MADDRTSLPKIFTGISIVILDTKLSSQLSQLEQLYILQKRISCREKVNRFTIDPAFVMLEEAECEKEHWSYRVECVVFIQK